MKYTITKTEFEALGEVLKNEYTLDGETATLKIEGDDAPTLEKIAEIEKKRELEVEHRKNAEKKLKEADDRAAKLQKDLESASGKDDLERLRTEHQQQLDQLRKEREEESLKYKQERDRQMVRAEAQKIAAKFAIADLILPKIEERLYVEEVSGQAVVRTLNINKEPSIASVSELQKEFIDNANYKPYLIVTPGSGGGASGGGGGGASGKKWSELTGLERTELRRKDPDQANRLMEAEGIPTS